MTIILIHGKINFLLLFHIMKMGKIVVSYFVFFFAEIIRWNCFVFLFSMSMPLVEHEQNL